jgi:hypothetical protein
MTGVAHNSSKRCSPAQRATTLSLVCVCRLWVEPHSPIPSCVLRACIALGNLGKGHVDLLPRLSSSLVANAIPCLAAYQVSTERGARRTACQYLARLQTEMKTRHKAVVSGLTFASACTKAKLQDDEV